MHFRDVVARGLLVALLFCAVAPAVVVIGVSAGGSEAWAQGDVIRSIQVRGNRRVEPETVRSYLQFAPGDSYNPAKVDDSLKALFATGLFSDVRIGREGATVVITVEENPVVNRVAFEGNAEIDDDTLKAEVQLKERAVFTRARVQSDVQRILEVYRRGGRFAANVDPKIINLEHNRVDLVFEIQEGPKTTVRSIAFVGNEAFSDSQLSDVITTTETGLLSFFKPTNIYDPDRLNLDRELLRQFYLKNGYADVSIVSANADLDRDGQGFFLTFTIEEGEQYRFGDINIETSLESVDTEALMTEVETKRGKIYNASKIDDTVEDLTIEVSSLGYAFARVRPQVDRDPVGRTVGLTYEIDEGSRVYIERIEIVGNTRTLDEVIRREFRVSEGDAYNRHMVEAAKRRLRSLRFFKSVEINRKRGSAPDRVVLVVNVVEQHTGELSLGGGYSTAEGPIADISVTERNLLGKGQYVRLKLAGSFERYALDFSFTQPYFMDRNMSAGFDLFHTEVDYTSQSSFRFRRSGGQLRLGIPLGDDWKLQTRYVYSVEDIFDVRSFASPAIRNAKGESTTSSVGYSLTYDTRNHKKKPTQGLYFSLSQDVAGLGGDVSYIRTIGEGRGYYPVTKDITLVGRAVGGHIEGLGEEVRLVDVFFKGGETVRGFDKGGFGPRDLRFDDALGGTIYFAGTAEVRFPFPVIPESFGMGGAFFFDAGTLYETGELGTAIDPSDVADDSTIRSSVGFSVLWDSPIGPLRADIAAPLTYEDYDDKEIFRFGASTRF